ncbi:MAG TPA: folate-binding protein [Candidatus Binatia bacterium]|nr:folate-binding protein [Candidatus Binatia bacterium]
MKTDSAFFVRLATRGLIAVRGADTDGFLQGQLSSDLRQLTAAQAQLSSYNSAKGRLLAVLHLLRAGDAVLMATALDVVDPVMKRLRMFVLRSKVTLDDASSEWTLFGAGGPHVDTALGPWGPLPATPLAVTESTRGIRIVRALGPSPRYLLLVPAAEVNRTAAALAEVSIAGTLDDWQRLEIEAGVPTVHAATQDRFVPQMCNLDQLGGISFDKGCYTGQEVVARVHYLGAVKRRMTRIHLDRAPPAPGEKIAEGEVVDAVADADGGCVALVVG